MTKSTFLGHGAGGSQMYERTESTEYEISQRQSFAQRFERAWCLGGGNPLDDPFGQLLVALADEELRYLLVGSYAYTYHALPERAHDLDLWVPTQTLHSKALVRTLEAAGYTPQADGDWKANLQALGGSPTFGEPPRTLHLHTKVAGLGPFEEAWTRAVLADLDGLAVAVLGKDDLIANRLQSNNPWHLEQAAYLLNSKRWEHIPLVPLPDGGPSPYDA